MSRPVPDGLKLRDRSQVSNGSSQGRPSRATRRKKPPRNTGRASCAAGSNMNSKSNSAAPSVSLTAITDHLRNYRKEPQGSG